jgi:hypothetical protein
MRRQSVHGTDAAIESDDAELIGHSLNGITIMA